MTLEQAAEVAQQNTQRQRNLQDYIKFNAMQPAMESAADLQDAQNQLALQGAGQAAATQSAQQRLAEAQAKAGVTNVPYDTAAQRIKDILTGPSIASQMQGHANAAKALSNIYRGSSQLVKNQMVAEYSAQHPNLNRIQVVQAIANPPPAANATQAPDIYKLGIPGVHRTPAVQQADNSGLGGATSTAQQANNLGLGQSLNAAQISGSLGAGALGATPDPTAGLGSTLSPGAGMGSTPDPTAGLGATAQSLYSPTANQTPMVQIPATTVEPFDDTSSQTQPSKDVTQNGLSDHLLNKKIDPNTQNFNDQLMIKNMNSQNPKGFAQAVGAAKAASTIQRLKQLANDVAHYAGPAGQARLIGDKLIGSSDPRYIAYQNAGSTVSLLADQLRQQMGTSVGGDMNNQLREMVMLKGWESNPKSVIDNLNSIAKLIHQENRTTFATTPGFLSYLKRREPQTYAAVMAEGDSVESQKSSSSQTAAPGTQANPYTSDMLKKIRDGGS